MVRGREGASEEVLSFPRKRKRLVNCPFLVQRLDDGHFATACASRASVVSSACCVYYVLFTRFHSRQYDQNWENGGGSTNTNSQTYKGAYAFSEEESTTLTQFERELNIAKLMDFHSYGMATYGMCRAAPTVLNCFTIAYTSHPTVI